MECMQIDSLMNWLSRQALEYIIWSTAHLPLLNSYVFFAFDFIIVTKSSVVGKKTRKQHNIYEKALS